jgi:predicted Zn finger-like uncharacterized protein
MKITCQACQARYTIADDKVVGKMVKIRCKKCGETIIVNASEPPGPPSAVAASLGGSSAPVEAWTVNVADGDQRTMTAADVAAAYVSKLIDDETLCWKEGMPDWLALHEIGPLREACVLAASNPAAASALPRVAQDELPTRIFDSSKEGSLPGPAPAPMGSPEAQAPVVAASAVSNGTPAAATPAAAAARRTGGRGPSADLFRGAAQAGGEDDVMTSAPVGAPAAFVEGQKLIGERNENSVLFSIGALTGRAAGTATAQQSTVGEASGLFDIRQLGARAPAQSDQKKKTRVDDIMNLGSGSLNAAMSAPVLAVPMLDKYTAPTGLAAVAAAAVSAQVRNKVLIVLAVCASGFFVVAAIGTAMWVMRNVNLKSEDQIRTVASVTVDAASEPPLAANAPTEPSAAAPSSEPMADAAPPPAKEAPTKAQARAAKAAAAAAGGGETGGASPPVAAAAPPKEAAPAPAVASDQPFNMGEARARLGTIADGVQSCRKGSTTGTGRVVITFNPNGSAQSAVLTPGSPFDGTPTGACVASRFRGARVPPFAGSPFPVSKSFTIN